MPSAQTISLGCMQEMLALHNTYIDFNRSDGSPLDLSYHTVTNLKFTNLNLSDANLRGTNFINCIFDSLSIRDGDGDSFYLTFESCRFNTLSLADLRTERLRFSHCIIEGLNMTKTQLRDVQFHECTIFNIVASRATITNLIFTSCKLVDTSRNGDDAAKSNVMSCLRGFSNSTLFNAKFDTCSIEQAPFVETKAPRLTVLNSTLKNINATNARIHRAVIDNTSFDTVNLAYAEIKESYLKNTSFTRPFLLDTDMADSELIDLSITDAEGINGEASLYLSSAVIIRSQVSSHGGHMDLTAVCAHIEDSKLEGWQPTEKTQISTMIPTHDEDDV